MSIALEPVAPTPSLAGGYICSLEEAFRALRFASVFRCNRLGGDSTKEAAKEKQDKEAAGTSGEHMVNSRAMMHVLNKHVLGSVFRSVFRRFVNVFAL